MVIMNDWNIDGYNNDYDEDNSYDYDYDDV